MRLIVAGSRMYNNDFFIEKILDEFREEYGDSLELVSGTAKGPDTVAIEYAKKHNIKCHEFPAKWDELGKSAGHRRNEEMAGFADGLLAFHCMDSKGTKNMIESMERREKSYIVYDIVGKKIKGGNLTRVGIIKTTPRVCSCGEKDSKAIDLYTTFSAKYLVGKSVCEKCIASKDNAMLTSSRDFIKSINKVYVTPKFEKIKAMGKDDVFELDQFYSLQLDSGEFKGLIRCVKEDSKETVFVYHNQMDYKLHNHTISTFDSYPETVARLYMPNEFVACGLVTGAFFLFKKGGLLHRRLIEGELIHKVKLLEEI
ncbi:MAG: DUF2493 domain-containing protein [Sarcina sp.]